MHRDLRICPLRADVSLFSFVFFKSLLFYGSGPHVNLILIVKLFPGQGSFHPKVSKLHIADRGGKHFSPDKTPRTHSMCTFTNDSVTQTV